MDNSLKEVITSFIKEVVGKSFPSPLPPFTLERVKKKEWGDLSTNLPFLLSNKGKRFSKTKGDNLAFLLSQNKLFSRVEFVAPGFLNFFLSSSYLQETLTKIVQEGQDFTRFSVGQDKLVQVEFISANPTGPLHVGHGRAAALGDALANNLSKLGFKVQKEYYVNDVGGQINRLAKSLWIRIRQIEGEKVNLPEDGYKGEYLIDIAKNCKQKMGSIRRKSNQDIFSFLSKFVVEETLRSIKSDLREFGVRFDRWFFESEIYNSGQLSEVLSFLQKKGFSYEKDGAMWFKTSALIEGEQDRVLRKKDGEYTYFASDAAYHLNKFERGFYKVIDIWGADHIGYAPRMKAVVQAMGYPEGALKTLIYQLVALKRGGKRVSASTRGGEFIPLKEILKEVGKDAARFFFLSRSADSHLDFDLELAKKQTPENPVFYVQYAHARICSILRKAKEQKFYFQQKRFLSLLETPEERDLMLLIALLPDQVKEAGERLEPHHLTVYAKNLASAFHQFYARHRVITENKNLTEARLFLVQAVKIAVMDILGILGIFAPERM